MSRTKNTSNNKCKKLSRCPGDVRDALLVAASHQDRSSHHNRGAVPLLKPQLKPSCARIAWGGSAPSPVQEERSKGTQPRFFYPWISGGGDKYFPIASLSFSVARIEECIQLTALTRSVKASKRQTAVFFSRRGENREWDLNTDSPTI